MRTLSDGCRRARRSGYTVPDVFDDFCLCYTFRVKMYMFVKSMYKCLIKEKFGPNFFMLFYMYFIIIY